MIKPKRTPALLHWLLGRIRQGSLVVSARRLVAMAAFVVFVSLLLPLFFLTRASYAGVTRGTSASRVAPMAAPQASLATTAPATSPFVRVFTDVKHLIAQLAPQTATAAASDNLNFQARLQATSGAIVPDGYYNIQFKLYSASTGGSALWTETYAYNSGSGACTGPLGANDCRVRVANGYVSVYLGSQTAFPANMPWDQQLYLTMNIGGVATTGSYPTMGDGEMSPRLKLTAVPYAMKANSANQLLTTNGSNTATLSIASPTTTGTQTFVIPDQGAAGTYNILTAPNGSDGYVKLQPGTLTQQTGGLSVSGNGIIGGILQGGTLKAGSTQQFQVDASGNVTTSGSISTGTGSLLTVGGATLNNTLAISNLATGGNIGTAAATVDVYTNFTVAQTTAGQTLTIPAPTTTTTGRLIYITNVGSAGYTIGGSVASPGTTMAFVWNSTTSTWTLVSSGTTGAYIQNGTALQTANFNIQSYSTTSVTATIQGANSQSANILEVKAAGVGTPLFSVGPSAISLGEDAVLAGGKSLTISGGNTASRPASPTEGMLYYDTDTHQLLVYNGGKWKADGSEAILVAASNSSDADKAAADYVADGNTGAANDGDQVQINQALAAADPAGTGRKSGKVYLFAGTYTIDASISVPNNTTLAGSGNGTVITIPNAFNADINAVTNTTTGGNGTGITIQDLKLDGNSANQASNMMVGVKFNGVGSGSGSSAVEGGKVTNVTAVNWHLGVGIMFESSSNGTITNSTVEGDSYGGIRLNSSSNNTVTANIAQGNSDGIILSAGSSNNAVSGNTAQGNGNGIVVEVGSFASNSITGNIAQGNTGYGIELWSASNNTVSSNTLYDNGGNTSNGAIYLYASSNNIVTSNNIADTSATTTNYAIRIFSTSNTNYLAANALGGGSIYDAGTGTIYGGQVNDLGNYVIQPAGTIELMKDTNITGAISGTSSLTLGTASTTNGSIVFNNNTNGYTVTIQTGAQTHGNFTLTIPNLTANATICTDNSVCSGYASASTAYVQGGNTFGATATLGTNDANSLVFRTNSTTAITVDASQNTTFAGNLTLAANKTITLTGGTTASRPASPTEGMLYYDTDTKQLLTYANGKWQGDRTTTTKIVAASNSSQAEKDAADYVATATNAQTAINNALTAAAGGKVYLMEGTYTIGASISIPNNTTLAGAGVGTVITVADNFNNNINAITNTTNGGNGTGITIQDLKLDGNKTHQSSGSMNGIYFDGVGSGTGSSAISGGKVMNVQASNWYNGSGIYLLSSSNNTITNNTVQKNYDGIRLDTSTNNTVVNNTVQGTTNTAVYLTSASSNNLVANNTTQGGNSGIFISYDSNANTITSNTIQGNSYAGIAASGSDNIITSNTLQLSVSAIDISFSTNTYLANNNLGGGSISDGGSTGTVYGGQVNTAGNYVIQSAGTVELMNDTNVTGAISGTSNLTLGTSNSTNGTIVLKNSTNANTVSLYSLAQTGNFNLKIPVLTADATICTDNSVCSGYASASTAYVQGGNTFGATATLGTNDANSLVFRTNSTTAITVDASQNTTFAGNVSLAAGKNITFASGAGNFDQGSSTGTFKTGTGAVSLNGDTTVATGKNFTVTNGTTSITGTTNINTSGAAVTSIGTGTGNNSIGNTTGTLGLTGSTVTVLGATSINTTGSATTSIGNSTGTLQLSSNTFNLSTAGAITGATGISMASGNFLQSGTGTFGTGTGVVSLNGNTNIANTASLATKAGTTFTTPGASTSAALNVASYYLMNTSGAAQVIQGIAAGRDGQILALTNINALSVTLSNNNASATGSKLSTGTGGDITLPTGGSIELIYDSTNSLWRVVSTSATSGGYANTALSNLGTTNINQALNTTAGDLTLQTTTSGNINIAPAGTINLNSNTTVATGKNFTVTSGTTSLTGTTNINTTGTATTTIGSNTGGAVAIAANAASSFTTNTGNLTLDAAAQLQLGTANATSVLLGKTNTTVTVQGGFTSGSAAGTGTFTNNGSTKNVSLALGDLAAGSIGTAATTVDVYTSFTISPTAAGRTYTIPAPTDGAAGRTIYISNINATNTFIIGSTTFNTHSTATLVYDGTSWNFAGMDGGSNNYIQNQNSSTQTANFRINGTGQVAGIDALSGAGLALGATNATSITLGNTTNTTAISMQGTTAATYTIGTATGTGTITLGQSTASNTINIGHATIAAGNTQTVNIGDAATGTGKNVVTVGSTNGASQTTVQAGTAGLTLGATAGNVGITTTTSGNISLTTAGNFTVNGAAASIYAIGASTVAGTVTIGGTAQTGTMTLGQSTASNSISIGAAAGNGATQAISIGTSATAGSTTNVTIGSTVAGTTTVQGTTGIALNSATITTNATTLSFLNTNAATVTMLQAGTSISVGATTGTFTVRNANTTVGSTAGSGTLTNNGSTKNVSLALGDLAAGSIGTAATTVDVYTSFTISPTAAGRTYTIPAPTDGAAGRTIYISNINATNTFIIGSTTFNTHSTATLVYDGTSWNFAGMDGGSNNYIQNQTAVSQSAGFNVSGAGTLGGLLTASAGATVTGTTSINTTGSATTSIGSNTGGAVTIAANAASSFITNSGALTLTSAAAATWGTNAGLLTLQGMGGTTVTSTAGTSSSAVTISSGNASAGASGNVLIDTGTFTTGTPTVSIGTGNASGVTLGKTTTTVTVQGTLTAAKLGVGIASPNANIQVQGTLGIIGPVSYPVYFDNSPSSAYWTIDKSNTASDASVVFRDQGVVKAEIGLVTDNNIHFKTATGAAGSETYTDRLIIQATGETYTTGKLGVGTVPTEQLHVAASSSASKVLTKIENTNTGAGSRASGLQLASSTNNWTVGTDVGLNGSTNFAIQDNNFGYMPRFFIDSTGRVGIGTDAPGYKLDVAGDFHTTGAATIAGLLTASVGATVSGAAVNLNVSSNFAVNIGTGTTTSAVSIGNSANITNLASRTINIGTIGATNVIQGIAQTATNAVGDQLTIKGSAGNGTNNGGSLLLSGGDAGATGYLGLVNLNPTAFIGTSQNCTVASCSITNTTVNANSTVLVNNTYAGSVVSLADPNVTTAGRVLYVTNSGTQDMTLSANGGGAGNTIALKKNTTATMFWNGVDWTAAGASSATDLQAAYNNTQTSAGGAEIVLNSANQGAGLTIRNDSTPLIGALFEVQSSIAANLFSVNNNTTEYAANGGVESGTTSWAGISTSPTQNGTLSNVASGLYSLSVPITANSQGAKNTLASTLTANTTYVVSFAAKTAAAGSYTFNTYYSIDGTANSVNCNNTLAGSGYTLTNNFTVTNTWTKVSCFITTPASGMTAANAIRIVETNMGASGTFYIDNLSVISNASGTTPANVQIGGGATGGQPTLFTLDQFAGPPMSTDNSAYYGSMYYDTTKNAIQCYQKTDTGGVWGACGSAPDDIISMTPEYTGAVLNGTGVGTMTADFCGNIGSATLQVNTSLCSTVGEARNFYRWTSPQPSAQTYSIYVSYRLPSTFKAFKSGTMSLTGLIDSTSNAGMTYSVFRKAAAGGIQQCSADTSNIGVAGAWTSISPATDITASSCAAGGANPFVAGDQLIIRITVSAQSSANAYVENLTFQYSNK